MVSWRLISIHPGSGIQERTDDARPSLGDRSGDDQHAGRRLRRSAPGRGPGPGRGAADLPPFGLGRARPGCPAPIGRAAGDPCARRIGRPGRSDRGHRPDQPARDDDRLGAGDRQGHRAGPGLAGSADRPGLRTAQGPTAVGLRADRPGHRPVLLRDQDRLDSGQRPRGPPPRRGRRAGRGDG